jgi:hypothetical protein
MSSNTQAATQKDFLIQLTASPLRRAMTEHVGDFGVKHHGKEKSSHEEDNI